MYTYPDTLTPTCYVHPGTELIVSHWLNLYSNLLYISSSGVVSFYWRKTLLQIESYLSETDFQRQMSFYNFQDLVSLFNGISIFMDYLMPKHYEMIVVVLFKPLLGG